MSYPAEFWAAAAAAAALKAGWEGQPVALGSRPAWSPEKAEKAEGGNCSGSPFLSNIISLRSYCDVKLFVCVCYYTAESLLLRLPNSTTTTTFGSFSHSIFTSDGGRYVAISQALSCFGAPAFCSVAGSLRKLSTAPLVLLVPGSKTIIEPRRPLN